ncbi:MAG TPA: hypothetical protein VFZ34_29595, partial [Blastocatellia bacterium]|nr:hypothetical protein [Blastocatellia bacterium]
VALYPGGPAWSPNGQFIAFAATGQTENKRRPMNIFVVNIADKSERQLGGESWAEMGRVAWLGDGSGLVLSARADLAEPRQLWFVAWPSGVAHKITNDLHDYDDVSVSADSQTLTVVQSQESLSIAVAPQASLVEAREIYTEVGRGDERLAWTSDGRLLYASRVSGNWDIWLMNKDGSEQRRLTVDPHNDTMPAVSADGRFIYFSSDRTGAPHIWRMGIDGGGATQLTSGGDHFFPEVTPDGQWLFYQQGGLTQNKADVWRVPQTSGTPTLVNEESMAERQAQRPAISPDGKWLAYVSLDQHGWGVLLRSLSSGAVVKRFNFPAIIGPRDFRWMPDSQALAYIVQEKGVTNLWLQPLNGAPPKPLTTFKTGRFSVFAWTPDGQWLAYLRPSATSDVVFLRNFK